ncbi:hypothetical protein, partial [Alistipes communis]
AKLTTGYQSIIKQKKFAIRAVCLSFERDIRGSFSSGGIAVSGPMADASGRAAEFVGQAACGMKNRHAAHCAACRFCRSWRIGYLKKIEEISL